MRAITDSKVSKKEEVGQKTLYQKILNYSVYIVLFTLIVIFSFISDAFLSKANLMNFFSQIPTVGIITLVVTMVLITGAIDLSVAAIAAFAGTFSAFLAVSGYPIFVVIPVALASGTFWGLTNSFFITRFKLEPFILTLGTNYIIRGLILFATNGIYVKGLPGWFYKISNTRFFGGYLSSNTLIFFILIVVFAFIMKKTRFGRYCYAVGSNPEAARLSGIKTDRHVMKVYALEGTIAALAGILLMSNLNVGAPAEGVGLDLFAVAAAIMGGAQFGGGIGTIAGAVAGIFTIQVFQNGLAVLGVNTYMQQVVTGLIIVTAIIIDYLRKKSAKN